MTSTKKRDKVDEIKSCLDIVDLIQREPEINLRHIGNGEYVGSVPPMGKSGASLKVNQKTQIWHDMKNGKGGDVFDWIGERNGLDARGKDFPEVLRIAADMAGVELADMTEEERDAAKEKADIHNLFTEAAKIFHNNLKNRPELYNYIQEKWGITPETVDKYKIGYATSGRNLKGLNEATLKKSGMVYVNNGRMGGEVFQGRILFPYWKNGKVVYLVGRETDETPEAEREKGMKYKKLLVHKTGQEYVSPAVQNSYFYGEDSLRSSDYCIITEGVADCIVMLQAGFTCISPVTVKFREKDHPKLISLTHRLKRVYICNDNEESKAGLKGALSTAEALERAGIETKLIKLPKPEGLGKIDIADYMKTATQKDFQALMDASLRLWDFKLQMLEIPASATSLDRLSMFKDFIANELQWMEQEDWEPFVNNDVLKKFGFKPKDVKTALTNLTGIRRKETGTDNAARERETLPQKKTFLEALENVEDSLYPYIVDEMGIGTLKKHKHVEDENGNPQEYIDYFIDTPASITAIGDDLDSEKTYYKVNIKGPRGSYIELWRDQAEFLTRAGVLRLIADGLTCTEEDHKEVSRYFRKDIARANYKAKREYIAESTGWKRNKSMFVTGNKVYTQDGDYPVTMTDPLIKTAYGFSGTLDEWVKGVKPLFEYDITMLTCSVACAATILDLIGHPSIIFHNKAKSSTGKTLRAMVAVSMFGNPYEILTSADGTKTGIERQAAANNGMCGVMDETSDSKNIHKMTYMLGNGRGKPRGNPTGRDKVSKWRSTFLLTGEFPMLKETDPLGKIARLIECNWTMPGNEPELAKRVEMLLNSNYGHLSGKIIKKVMEEKVNIPRRYEEIYRNLPDTNIPAGNRIRGTIAAIATAGEILEKVFKEIGIHTSNPLEICERLYIELLNSDRMKSYGERALSIVFDYVNSHDSEFDTNCLVNGKTASSHIHSGQISLEYIDFYPDRLKDVFEEKEINYSQAIEEWRDAGITECDPSRLQKAAWINGMTKRIIRIKIREMYRKLGLDPILRTTHKGETEQTQIPENEHEKAPNDTQKGIIPLDLKILHKHMCNVASGYFGDEDPDISEFLLTFLDERPEYRNVTNPDELMRQACYLKETGWKC